MSPRDPHSPTESAFDLSRRDFLRVGAAAGASLFLNPSARLFAADPAYRPRVAAIYTVFSHRYHAHVILENFLQDYLFNGRRTDPGVDVVSFYADQRAGSGDMTDAVAAQFQIPVFDTINGALCLGGKELAVDAVLSIGEHGDYPKSPLGQIEYPRKRFFDEIVATMRRSQKFVPIFNDKHLSFRWDWAKEMYDTSRELGIPFMAGSSVPLAQRRPNLELPAGAEIEEAVSIHGGPVESYDFHGLEVLQSMVESRKGGETGISSIQLLEGDALWKAADAGRWSKDLAEQALAAELGKIPTDFSLVKEGESPRAPHGLLVTYKDGFRATVLGVGHSSTRWDFACRLKGDPKIHATSFYVGPWQNRNLFKALSHAIQTHFREKKSPYPLERTLLVTGALAAAMESQHQGGQPVATPHLEFGYAAQDFRAMREMGDSWKIITEDTPEPMGITPQGLG